MSAHRFPLFEPQTPDAALKAGVQQGQVEGLPALELRSADGSSAVVLLQGAQVVSWLTPDGKEQLYLSPKSSFATGQAIRVTGADERPLWVRKALGGLYIGTTKDVYWLDGTGAERRRGDVGIKDGRVVAIRADGGMEQLGLAKGGAWIDALAVHPDGGVAWSAGRSVVARDAKGREKTFEAPSSARGLVFAPKGYRLGVAHYNGVSLWYPNLETPAEVVTWKGSHIDVTWSPDGRFVVSTMQENSLHGWRLQPDRGHMRMSGYPGKVRSMSWSFDGNWLATSGAEAASVVRRSAPATASAAKAVPPRR